MSSLKSLIDRIVEVSNRYHSDCTEIKLLIKKNIHFEPGILSINTIRGVGTRSWTNENFQNGIDEIKGVNLFILRLCEIYKYELQFINNSIEDIYSELKVALRKYDEQVTSQWPLTDYQSDMYEQDRWNILRPIKDLEILKNEILSECDYSTWINSEIEKRKKRVIEHNNYTLESVQKIHNDFIDLISKIEI